MPDHATGYRNHRISKLSPQPLTSSSHSPSLSPPRPSSYRSCRLPPPFPFLLSESKDSIDTCNHRSLTCGRAKSRLDCGLFVGSIPVQFKIGVFFIFGTSDRIIRAKRRQANRRSAWRCIVDDCVNGGPSLPPNATSFH